MAATWFLSSSLARRSLPIPRSSRYTPTTLKMIVITIPADWRQRWPIRRYGFHGLSHAYAARRAAEMTGRRLVPSTSREQVARTGPALHSGAAPRARERTAEVAG